jgi:transposase InsO family protein
LRTDRAIEDRILALRDGHPAWGARKIARCLEREGPAVPAVSTVHEILRRHGRVVAPQRASGAYRRFEKEAPNQLWQMDFKGWVRLANGAPCHPLTVVDDHSRYAVCLTACANQRNTTVRSALETTFRCYGLPDAMYVDNGNPWGDWSGQRFTHLGVWLLKLGIELIHSRPYRPQGRGKNERFHRALNAEVFAARRLRDFAEAQRAFDTWRTIYNLDRPHEALDLEVPASRYRVSTRPMPDQLPPVEYDEHDIVRTVSHNGWVRFKGRRWRVPEAFRGERIAIRPRGTDGHHVVCFGAHEIATIDLTNPKCVSYVPEQVSAMSPD